jgi:hypothetical protein
MILRSVLFIAVFLGLAFAAQVKITVAGTCPTQTNLQSCSLEQVAFALAPQVTIEKSCSGTAIPLTAAKLVEVLAVRGTAFSIVDEAARAGLHNGGVERPPKGCSI